jgi:hypothetical protein
MFYGMFIAFRISPVTPGRARLINPMITIIMGRRANSGSIRITRPYHYTVGVNL